MGTKTEQCLVSSLFRQKMSAFNWRGCAGAAPGGPSKEPACPTMVTNCRISKRRLMTTEDDPKRGCEGVNQESQSNDEGQKLTESTDRRYFNARSLALSLPKRRHSVLARFRIHRTTYIVVGPSVSYSSRRNSTHCLAKKASATTFVCWSWIYHDDRDWNSRSL